MAQFPWLCRCKRDIKGLGRKKKRERERVRKLRGWNGFP